MKNFFLLILVLFFFSEGSGQTWIQRSSLPAVGRHRASAFALGNKGYVGLGHVNGNGVNIAYKDWWAYDPATDSWTQVADFPVVAYGVESFATETHGYAGGGATLNHEFYEYDPQVNTWTRIADCPGTPGDQACFAVNNKGYVIQADSLYEYDPATTSWSTKQNAPVIISSWTTGFSIGSSGYIKNGSSLYEYKPLENQWILKAHFPGVASNSSGTFEKDGKGYIVTGYVGSLTTVTSEVWEFNPGDDTWTQKDDFPGTSRRFSVAFTLNNKGYFATGTNGINLNDFWEYGEVATPQGILQVKTAGSVVPSLVCEQAHFDLRALSKEQIRSGELRIYSSLGELTDAISFTDPVVDVARNGKADGVYFYNVLINGRSIRTGKLIFAR